MTGAITSRHVSEVEVEDRITWTPEDAAHTATVLRSRPVTGGMQQLTVHCHNCGGGHVWEISRTQLITVQRTPR